MDSPGTTASRRILHFGKHEVFWECNERNASERRPDGYNADSERVDLAHDRNNTLDDYFGLHCWDHWIEWSRIRNTVQNKRTREDQKRARYHPSRESRALFDRIMAFFGINLMKKNIDEDSFNEWRELVEQYS